MAKDDLEQLMNALIPFAQQMLKKEGEFYPFGVQMDAGGTIALATADTGEESPTTDRLIAMMTAGFQKSAKAGELRAAGICYDVRVAEPGSDEKTDAICVKIEHADGEALVAYVPYRKGRLGGMKYGKLFATKGEPTFFKKGGRGN